MFYAHTLNFSLVFMTLIIKCLKSNNSVNISLKNVIKFQVTIYPINNSLSRKHKKKN